MVFLSVPGSRTDFVRGRDEAGRTIASVEEAHEVQNPHSWQEFGINLPEQCLFVDTGCAALFNIGASGWRGDGLVVIFLNVSHAS